VAGLYVLTKGYLSSTTMFKMNTSKAQDTMSIVLNRIIEGGKVSFEHFYFVGSKAILLPRSTPQLSKLKKLLAINDKLCVEVIGHVNYPNRPPVGKNSFEYNLSIARSKAIYEELVESGIASERMFYTGRGNSEMVHPKPSTMAEEQKNRRVEIRIASCSHVATSPNDALDEHSYSFY